MSVINTHNGVLRLLIEIETSDRVRRPKAYAEGNGTRLEVCMTPRRIQSEAAMRLG